MLEKLLSLKSHPTEAVNLNVNHKLNNLKKVDKKTEIINIRINGEILSPFNGVLNNLEIIIDVL